MADALVSPDIIRWARVRRNVSEAQLAKSVGATPNRIRDWEMGSQRPTFRQAQQLARALRIPFGYLFLATPPDDHIRIPDLRTVATRDARQPSPDLIDLLHSLRRKQDWYREFLESHGANRREFVGSASDNDSPLEVAARIRNFFVNWRSTRVAAASWSDYLRRLVSDLEDVGILVLRSGIVGTNTHRKLDISEFRGLAMIDDYAPLIFINSNDSKAAQIFTLAHELAHIWLGQSGVSDITAATDATQVDQRVELICNSTAAHLLVPEDEFREAFSDGAPIAPQLTRLATAFRVSTIVVLRRALDLGYIDRTDFVKQLANERAKQVEPDRGGSGGSFRSNLYARNGKLLVDAVLESVLNGQTLYRDGATVLDLKSATLSNVASDYPFVA